MAETKSNPSSDRPFNPDPSQDRSFIVNPSQDRSFNVNPSQDRSFIVNPSQDRSFIVNPSQDRSVSSDSFPDQPFRAGSSRSDGGRGREYGVSSSYPRAQCHKTFYGRNLRVLVISYSVCPYQAFTKLERLSLVDISALS